jgi:FMN-dependent NADH-azoreductase
MWWLHKLPEIPMQLLHIDSAITGAHSVSRQLTAQIVAAWKANHPGTQVSYLDLVADAPAHFTMDAMAPRTGQTDGLSEVQKRENAVSERLVSQFLAADVVVIGAPFYNFSIPTQLKAWIDRIAQPGRTFKYTANGPEGLAKGKTVIVASTRGGVYSTSEGGRAMEHQESYLQTVLGFFGVTDVRFVRAEGVAMGDAAKAQAPPLRWSLACWDRSCNSWARNWQTSKRCWSCRPTGKPAICGSAAAPSRRPCTTLADSLPRCTRCSTPHRASPGWPTRQPTCWQTQVLPPAWMSAADWTTAPGCPCTTCCLHAKVPVFQVSMPVSLTTAQAVDMGRALATLRAAGCGDRCLGQHDAQPVRDSPARHQARVIRPGICGLGAHGGAGACREAPHQLPH